jgi:hypothetical protein
MKTYGGVEYSSTILDLITWWRSASRLGRFTPGERGPGTDREGRLWYVSEMKKKMLVGRRFPFLYFFDESEFSNRLL